MSEHQPHLRSTAFLSVAWPDNLKLFEILSKFWSFFNLIGGFNHDLNKNNYISISHLYHNCLFENIVSRVSDNVATSFSEFSTGHSQEYRYRGKVESSCFFWIMTTKMVILSEL